jgi:hypothetical protein
MPSTGNHGKPAISGLLVPLENDQSARIEHDAASNTGYFFDDVVGPSRIVIRLFNINLLLSRHKSRPFSSSTIR